MKSIWLTYAWKDNQKEDVDFVAQQLRQDGVEVKLDRWELKAGLSLWSQIETSIKNKETKAWIIFATQNSLGSEACQKEVMFAFDRTMGERGESFPIIAIFPGAVDLSLLPASLKNRLNVSLQDANWTERIVASFEERSPSISRPQIEPYVIRVHTSGKNFVIEVRPRAGIWKNPFCAIKIEERHSVHQLIPGPEGGPPTSAVVRGKESWITKDQEWFMLSVSNPATPSESCYIYCTTLPSILYFGSLTPGEPQFSTKLRD